MLHAFEAHTKKRKRSEGDLEDEVDRYLSLSEWDNEYSVREAFSDCLKKENGFLDLENQSLSFENIRDSIIPFLNAHEEIKGIDLSNCDLEDASIIEIAHRTRIVRLYARQNDLSRVGVIELAKSAFIEHLNISNTGILEDEDSECIEAYRALARNCHLKRLTINNIEGSESALGDRASNLLLGSRSITHLGLRNNSISSKGLKRLKGNEVLLELDIAHNPIDAKGVQYILGSCLNKIDISYTEMSDSDRGLRKLLMKEGLSVKTTPTARGGSETLESLSERSLKKKKGTLVVISEQNPELRESSKKQQEAVEETINENTLRIARK